MDPRFPSGLVLDKARSVSSLSKTRKNRERISNTPTLKDQSYEIPRRNSDTWYNTWDMDWSGQGQKTVPRPVPKLLKANTGTCSVTTFFITILEEVWKKAMAEATSGGEVSSFEALLDSFGNAPSKVDSKKLATQQNANKRRDCIADLKVKKHLLF